MLKKNHLECKQVLQNQSNHIKNLINSRKNKVNSYLPLYLNATPEISESYRNQLMAHCNQYEKIKRFTIQLKKKQQNAKVGQSNKFWQVNQKIQRDLQKKLKHLKDIDNQIDQIVNRQFQTSNELQEIQQTIRLILFKKQQNHIHKAEPYFAQKQQHINNLKYLKDSKQKIKQVKINQISQILDILLQLKRHRQNRLKHCSDNYCDQDSLKLIDCLIKDLQQVAQNKKIYQMHQENQKKIMKIISQTSQKIQNLSRQLQIKFQNQQKSFQSLYQILKTKASISYFQQKILKCAQLKYNQTSVFVEKVSRFINNQSQKGSEYNQIQQGISTTNETINIFQQMIQNIESQNKRKTHLLKQIQKLQNQHLRQQEIRDVLSQRQSQIQKLIVQKAKLEKTMRTKADEADVLAYKSIHSQISKISNHTQKQQLALNNLKNNCRDSAKKLYNQTVAIQQQYRDILSEVVPQVWFRDQDFTKEETIGDLDAYLRKIFKRLSILD